MGSENIELRVRTVMGKVFGVEAAKIGDQSSPDTIETWDSLGHMNLVVALEEEFDFILDENTTVELLNYPLVLNAVRETLAAK